MKRILYASGSVLTGDEIADSVVKYATVLAKVGSADTITIPVVKDHVPNTVEMLVGPSSQFIIEDAVDESEAPGTDYAEFVAEIDEKRELLEHPASIQPAEGLTSYEDF